KLAFVVHRTARVDILVTLGGLKGRRSPLVERIRRLDVVMRVTQHRRLVWCVQPVGIDQRMSLGGDDLHVFHTSGAQAASDELSSATNVIFVLGRGAHAGNAEQVFQLAQESLLVLLREGNGG